MYLWKTQLLVAELKANAVNENNFKNYYLATSILVLACYYLAFLEPRENFLTLAVEAVGTIVVTVLGINAVFKAKEFKGVSIALLFEGSVKEFQDNNTKLPSFSVHFYELKGVSFAIVLAAAEMKNKTEADPFNRAEDHRQPQACGQGRDLRLPKTMPLGSASNYFLTKGVRVTLFSAENGPAQ